MRYNDKKGKILVVGKGGVIASELLKQIDCLTTSTQADQDSILLDFRTPEAFDYRDWGAGDAVVLLGAISSPDLCHKHYAQTYQVNVEGTSYFISQMLSSGVRVLFFSSDVVYGDRDCVVDENSETSPLGEYAHMKMDVENSFTGNTLFKVFRLSYVLSKRDSFYGYLKGCLENGHMAEVFHPLYRNVVSVYDVVDGIKAVLRNWNNVSASVVNVCGKHRVSRKDIADMFSKSCHGRLQYQTVAIDDAFWRARPKNVNVRSLYFEQLLGRAPQDLQQMVDKIVFEDSDK